MNEIVINNKKAYHDYTILETYVAGIVLTGTEIKSIRKGKASIVDSFCIIENGQIYLLNSYIEKFKPGTYNNHDVLRKRKLLLNKREISKLQDKCIIKGMAIIPLSMYINENGICKVDIALCKGKTCYDKRNSLKESDIKRQIEIHIKYYE